MKSAQPDINALHAAYVAATGLDISLRMDRERTWLEFLNCGWTADDVRLVVRYLKAGIARGERYPGAIRFRNLIGDTEKFEEELAAARQAFRNKPLPATRPEPRSHAGTSRIVEVPVATQPKPAPEAVASALDDLKRRIVRPAPPDAGS